jgi:hypothetical protein
MPTELVKDNQWWYSLSSLRPQVQGHGYIILSVGGRECAMIHSEVGRDGRPTYSYKFMSDADGDFWKSLEGTHTDIRVVQVSDLAPVVDLADDQPDVTTAIESSSTIMGNRVPVEATNAVRLASVLNRPVDKKTLFDCYVFIDWSASSAPKRGPDSIWIGTGSFGNTGDLMVDAPINASTRQEAELLVREKLLDQVREGRRVLVGFDFPYGYPANWNMELGQDNGSWLHLWQLLSARISDDARNQNNRCDVASDLNAATPGYSGPFWSRPNGNPAAFPSLPATKPNCFENGVVEYRPVEEYLRATGRHPKSVWQLFGNGVGGSQALLGIPVLNRLRFHSELGSCSKVWPFETGWKCPVSDGPLVVHAEIWPGAIPVDSGRHVIKDAAQMLSYVYWAAGLDLAGDLQSRFAPHEAPVENEAAQGGGWILGDCHLPVG